MNGISLADLAAMAGMILGTAGFVLGIVNYLRDHAKVIVKLKWDMLIAGGPPAEAGKPWGCVSVYNEGRRPIYISHVAIKLPKGYDSTYLLLSSGLSGQKLAEGDAPATFLLDQDQADMGKYEKDWKKMRAQVSASNGKEYYSKRNKRDTPSWAVAYERKRSGMSFFARLRQSV